MKRSIRAAAVLCAVAVALSVLLAGCKNEDDTNGNGSNGLGGHVGTNPFKGLTIVHEDEYESETFAFTSDTKGTKTTTDGEYWTKSNFEYAVDSAKGLLKYRETAYTSNDFAASSGSDEEVVVAESRNVRGYIRSAASAEKTITLDDFIAENFGNLDRETKSLVYEAYANNYKHYRLSADHKTVEMNSPYYFGNMAESGASFRYEDDAGNRFYFKRHMDFDIKDSNNSWHWYEGFTKFSGNTFTVVIFADNYDRETDTENYEKLSTPLIGTYQINGMGTNCTATVTFTQLPDELKGAFEENKPYTVKQQYNNEYTTYTVKN